MRRILSAYRKDEFTDPEGYTLQVGMVLEQYSDAVIEDIASPLSGIVRRMKFLPSISEIVDAAEAETARRIRIEKNRKLQVRKPERAPSELANVFVYRGLPLFAAMVERSKVTDWREYRIVDDGIWVPEAWIPNLKWSR